MASNTKVSVASKVTKDFPQTLRYDDTDVLTTMTGGVWRVLLICVNCVNFPTRFHGNTDPMHRRLISGPHGVQSQRSNKNISLCWTIHNIFVEVF